MFRSFHQTNVPLVGLSLAVFFVASSFAQLPELPLPGGATYVANRVVVLAQPGQVILPGEHAPDGWPATGIESLDQLCRQLGVVQVEPFYPGVLRRPGLARLASRLRVLTLEPGRIAGETIDALAADPALVSAELQTLPHLFYTPDDPYFSEQWHLPRIQAPAAWDFIRLPQTRHSVVAIIDTGLQLEHPEIQDNLWINEPEDLNLNGRLDPEDINGIDDDGNGFVDDVVGWDFAGNDNDPQEIHPHGTGVAACVSAVTDNGGLGAAVGFGVRMMAVKAINDSGQLTDGYLAMLYAADNGAQIINCSWGLPFHQTFEQSIIEAVWAEDVVIVAAGGEGDALTYPAAYQHVVAVSATDQNDQVTSFSPFGEYIDICAPGLNILTVWGDDFSILSGASFSAGIASGTIGLLRAQNPLLDNAATVQLMKQSADPIDDLNPGYEGLLGSGRINALAGVVSGLEIDDWTGNPAQIPVCHPNPFNATTSFHFWVPETGYTSLKIYDLAGKLVVTLIDGILMAGAHQQQWNGRDDLGQIAASGLYLYRIECGPFTWAGKLTMLK